MKSKTILKISKNFLFFFLGFICFAGILTAAANWPTVPVGSSNVAGWLGEIFDLPNSNSTKLVVDGNVIANEPTDATHLTTRKYVDDQITQNTATLQTYVNNKSAQTLVDSKTYTDTKIAQLEASLKAYIDSKISSGSSGSRTYKLAPGHNGDFSAYGAGKLATYCQNTFGQEFTVCSLDKFKTVSTYSATEQYIWGAMDKCAGWTSSSSSMMSEAIVTNKWNVYSTPHVRCNSSLPVACCNF